MSTTKKKRTKAKKTAKAAPRGTEPDIARRLAVVDACIERMREEAHGDSYWLRRLTELEGCLFSLASEIAALRGDIERASKSQKRPRARGNSRGGR